MSSSIKVLDYPNPDTILYYDLIKPYVNISPEQLNCWYVKIKYKSTLMRPCVFRVVVTNVLDYKKLHHYLLKENLPKNYSTLAFAKANNLTKSYALYRNLSQVLNALFLVPTRKSWTFQFIRYQVLLVLSRGYINNILKQKTNISRDIQGNMRPSYK